MESLTKEDNRVLDGSEEKVAQEIPDMSALEINKEESRVSLDQSDSEETLGEFKKSLRSKKLAVVNALADDVNHEVEKVDKKALSKEDSDDDNIIISKFRKSRRSKKAARPKDVVEDDPKTEAGNPTLERDNRNPIISEVIKDVIQDRGTGEESLVKGPGISEKDADDGLLGDSSQEDRDCSKPSDGFEDEVQIGADEEGDLARSKEESVVDMTADEIIETQENGQPDTLQDQEGTFVKFKRKSRSKKSKVIEGVTVEEQVVGPSLVSEVSLADVNGSTQDGLSRMVESAKDKVDVEPVTKFKRLNKSKRKSAKVAMVIDEMEANLEKENSQTNVDEDDGLLQSNHDSLEDKIQNNFTGEVLSKPKRVRRLKKIVASDDEMEDGKPITADVESPADDESKKNDDSSVKAKKSRTASKKKKTSELVDEKNKVAEDARDSSSNQKGKVTKKIVKEEKKTGSLSKQTSLSKNDSVATKTELVLKQEVSVKSEKASPENNVDEDESGSAGKNLGMDQVKRQSDLQRTIRKTKKRRHGDMAYEGDSDWDALMNGDHNREDKSIVDKESTGKGRPKGNANSAISNKALLGEEAAVAVGLKSCEAGPVEKIRFKEVLKRRGGLQEYLDCRNYILWLWSKDVRRILPLSDCGINTDPQPDEPSRATLIRDIYKFLDYHGYINIGIAVKKPKEKDELEPKLKISKESIRSEDNANKTVDSEEEVAFILGQIKGSEEAPSSDVKHIKTEGGSESSLLSVEDVKNMNGHSTLDRRDSQDSGVALMDIDKGPSVAMQSADESIMQTLNDLDAKGEVNLETKTEEPLSTALEVKPESDFGSNPPVVNNMKANTEDEFSDIDSARVLHDLCRHDVRKDLQIDNQVTECSKMPDASYTDSLTKNQKRVIIVGAGPSGLAAARHLGRQNFEVTVLEARNRVGGRVHTDRQSLSVPVDLGASIITGVEADVATERRPDPSALLCTQLGLELTVLNSDCPLYDSVTGQKVESGLDDALEREFNALLDDMVVMVAQKGEASMSMSLEEGFEYVLKKRRCINGSINTSETLPIKELNESSSLEEKLCTEVGILRVVNTEADLVNETLIDDHKSLVAAHENKTDGLSESDSSKYNAHNLNPLERRVMDWHFANLEYGCAAELKLVSLPNWNQDDTYGGFGGAHCMIKGGYSTVMEALAEGVNVLLDCPVTEIEYSIQESESKEMPKRVVKVTTEKGEEFVGDAVLITIPLGCLKANTIKFLPELPKWKVDSVSRLGFGVLNKVIMEFPKVFWDESLDYFGATAESTDLRGRCFMFWNLKKTVGSPVLIALVVGRAAVEGEDLENSEHVGHAVTVLRKLFGESAVPEPVASVTTNWGGDPYSRGAYSYVAIGASGEDYDIIGRPVEKCLFFAGEATCKEHPDTVGGAIMSGLREAVRIIDILENREDSFAEAEAMLTDQIQPESEMSEVRDMMKRLEISSFDSEQKSLSKYSVIQDMYGSARTTAGRLFLAKKMMQLSASTVKAFAGTREGLSILNKWILDSMGKDGTQLLRHCVRLLLIVSTDMLSVRQSGIGRTVKEKVCVHTSRDIRAIASQLVKMWIEIFRKEKASGGLKLLKHPNTIANNYSSSDTLKKRFKDQNIPKSSGSNSFPAKVNTDKKNSATNNKNSSLPSVKEVNKENNAGGPTNLDEDLTLEEDAVLSELEAKARAAEEAARIAEEKAKAAAAAQALASSEAECNTYRELPKIPSFHKFARQELHVHKEDSMVKKRKWSGAVLGKQDCSSEIDSRSCRVRNWSVDFSATCGNLENTMLGVSDYGGSDSNKKQRSHSNDVDSHSDLKEQSAETGMEEKCTDLQHQGSGTMSDFNMHGKVRHGHDNVNKGSQGPRNGNRDEGRGTEHIKKGISDYVASLLMPLYKTRRIDKDGYKSIMKKSTLKVLEHNSSIENAMTASEFLDVKRRNKIRSLVDKFIEKYLASKP